MWCVMWDGDCPRSGVRSSWLHCTTRLLGTGKVAGRRCYDNGANEGRRCRRLSLPEETRGESALVGCWAKSLRIRAAQLSQVVVEGRRRAHNYRASRNNERQGRAKQRKVAERDWGWERERRVECEGQAKSLLGGFP